MHKAFRKLLKKEGVHEINMIEPEGEGSWCMFIQSNNAKYYHEKIWDFYPADESWKEREKQDNWARLWTHWDTPFITTGLDL